jgi:oxamate amidohydrolase
MLSSAYGFNGGVSAPHRAAALAARDILAAGGSAVEAMVAAAAAIAVAYPHMNGIGGDGFWIIHRPGQAPVAVSGCGRAAGLASVDWYAAQGVQDALPARGALAALTVPGTIAGWKAALAHCPRGNRLPLADLLAPAIALAREGVGVTENQTRTTREKLDGLKDVPGFADAFLHHGQPPEPGHRLRQPALGATLARLAEAGLEDYYRGDLGQTHSAFLEAAGSPLRQSDFLGFDAQVTQPLTTDISAGQLWNMIPPTQGVASLMILGLYDRLRVAKAEGFDHIHGLIEATKLAFIRRNAELGDPDHMASTAQDWLEPAALDALGRPDRPGARPAMARTGKTGGYDLDGHGRFPGLRCQLYPIGILGIRLWPCLPANGRVFPESRRGVQPSTGAKPAAPPCAAFPHAEPRAWQSCAMGACWPMAQWAARGSPRHRPPSSAAMRSMGRICSRPSLPRAGCWARHGAMRQPA